MLLNVCLLQGISFLLYQGCVWLAALKACQNGHTTLLQNAVEAILVLVETTIYTQKFT